MARLASVLLIIGGLNWLLVGLFQFDFVAAIFGGQSALLSRIAYAVIGVAAIYELFIFPRLRRLEQPPGPQERIGKVA